MPETIYKTVYACSICKCEYNQFHEAQLCENLPVLEQTESLKQYDVGDEITFNNEMQFGARWSYGTESGKITQKKIVCSGDTHQYLYWTENGHGVVWVKDEFGYKLFSPNELKTSSF